MTIEEVRKAKKDLEENVKAQMLTFEGDTGCTITGVHIETRSVLEPCVPEKIYIGNIDFEVKL